MCPLSWNLGASTAISFPNAFLRRASFCKDLLPSRVLLCFETTAKSHTVAVLKLDVRGFVHHNTIRKEKSNKMHQCIKIFIIPYLYEAQHVSGDTPPIIKSLKLHWQPLVFHTWEVVVRVFAGRCQVEPSKYTSNNHPRIKNHRMPVHS